MSRSEKIQSETPTDGTTARYVVRWNQLTSALNWEKGRIIRKWRQSVMDAGAEKTAYSDEAWSRKVGHVTAQHVGRLRRVFERFGSVRKDYDGLYWSHFQSALDWPDAEMWLEGSIRNRWSVSQMRQARWEAHGAPGDLKPRESDIITAEIDEDDFAAWENGTPDSISPSLSTVRDPGAPNLQLADDDVLASQIKPFSQDNDSVQAETDNASALSPQSMLEALDMPRDLAKAVTSLQRAIEHHKDDDWNKVSKRDVLAVLDLLKRLVRSA